MLSLIKRKTVIADQDTLETNQYFILMIYTTYMSYARNYREYKGDYYYHETDKCYYFDVFKQIGTGKYYISKVFNKIKDQDKGRVMIVTVNDATECIDLDSIY